LSTFHFMSFASCISLYKGQKVFCTFTDVAKLDELA
jgi:hypothetical protein